MTFSNVVQWRNALNQQHFDVAIIGAGPSGLCFARALAASGLRIALLERQGEAALVEPTFDGREIALTHHSVAIL